VIPLTDQDRPEARPVARPTDYSLDTAIEICARLAGGEPLTRICRDEKMPSLTTVYRWLADDQHVQFRDMYARCREDQADTMADEILEIADDGLNDWIVRAGDGEEGGGIVFNSEHVQRSRLRVDARKWIAAKLKPRKYGDRVTQEHTGGVEITHKRSADDLTDDELAAIAAGGCPAPSEPATSSD